MQVVKTFSFKLFFAALESGAQGVRRIGLNSDKIVTIFMFSFHTTAEAISIEKHQKRNPKPLSLLALGQK